MASSSSSPSPPPPPPSDVVDYQPPSTRDKAFPVAPKELRCLRMDGRLWQCKQYKIEGQRYCQVHYFQLVLKVKPTKEERRPTPTPAPVSPVRDSLQRTRGSQPYSLKCGSFSVGNGKLVRNSGDLVPVKNPRSKMGRNEDDNNEGLGKKLKAESDGEKSEEDSDSDCVGSFIRRAKLSEKLLNRKKKSWKAGLKDENNKSGEQAEQQVWRRGGLKSASINYKDVSSEETEEEELEMGREQTRARAKCGMIWGGSKGNVLRKNRSSSKRGTNSSNNGAVSVSVSRGKRKRSDWGASIGSNHSVDRGDIVYRRGDRRKKEKIDSNGIGNDTEEQGKRAVNGTKRQKVLSGSDEDDSQDSNIGDGNEKSQGSGESEEIDEEKQGRDNEAAGDHTDGVEENGKSETLLKREEKMGLLQMLKLEKEGSGQKGIVTYETRKKRMVPKSNHIEEAKEEVKTADKCISGLSAAHSNDEEPTSEPIKEKAVHIYTRRHR